MFNREIKDTYLVGVPLWVRWFDVDHLEEGNNVNT